MEAEAEARVTEKAYAAKRAAEEATAEIRSRAEAERAKREREEAEARAKAEAVIKEKAEKMRKAKAEAETTGILSLRYSIFVGVGKYIFLSINKSQPCFSTCSIIFSIIVLTEYSYT